MNPRLRALTRWAAVLALFGRLAPDISRAAEPPPDWSILIRPANYDPADPWEYTRSAGRLSPGASARGPIWNRPHAPLARPAHDSPRAAVLPIGVSLRGNPILTYLFGEGPAPLLIFAAIHGDEANTNDVAWRLITELQTRPQLALRRSVAVIPAANPDGLALRQRGNARGVDVNRNFPAKNWAPGARGRYFGGEQPLSEPESQALRAVIERLEPAEIIALHCIARGKHCNNFDGPGQALAERLAAENGYPVKATIGYPTPGSFGSWAGVDRQIATVTLEVPADLSGAAAWAENRAALLAAIEQAPAQRLPQIVPGEPPFPAAAAR